MKGKLYWAVIITFLVLGVLLSGVFWAVAWLLGAKGTGLMWASFAFVAVMVAAQWYLGPVIIKRMARLRECRDGRVSSMVWGLADQAGIPRPKVYIAEEPTPNAFAFGRTQSSSGIALHTGLLERLDEGEVRAVIAHEIGHIKHRDVMVMTLASALPVLLYYAIFFGMIFASSRDREGSPNYLGAWLGGMVAQLLATLLVLYLSRVREYYADAHSAQATRSPESLASALAKIGYSLARSEKPAPAGLKAFYIADPAQEYAGEMEKERKAGWAEIFMTHPPTWKRIRALRA